jgi:hypothetical protein
MAVLRRRRILTWCSAATIAIAPVAIWKTTSAQQLATPPNAIGNSGFARSAGGNAPEAMSSSSSQLNGASPGPQFNSPRRDEPMNNAGTMMRAPAAGLPSAMVSEGRSDRLRQDPSLADAQYRQSAANGPAPLTPSSNPISGIPVGRLQIRSREFSPDDREALNRSVRQLALEYANKHPDQFEQFGQSTPTDNIRSDRGQSVPARPVSALTNRSDRQLERIQGSGNESRFAQTNTNSELPKYSDRMPSSRAVVSHEQASFGPGTVVSGGAGSERVVSTFVGQPIATSFNHPELGAPIGFMISQPCGPPIYQPVNPSQSPQSTGGFSRRSEPANRSAPREPDARSGMSNRNLNASQLDPEANRPPQWDTPNGSERQQFAENRAAFSNDLLPAATDAERSLQSVPSRDDSYPAASFASTASSSQVGRLEQDLDSQNRQQQGLASNPPAASLADASMPTMMPGPSSIPNSLSGSPGQARNEFSPSANQFNASVEPSGNPFRAGEFRADNPGNGFDGNRNTNLSSNARDEQLLTDWEASAAKGSQPSQIPSTVRPNLPNAGGPQSIEGSSRTSSQGFSDFPNQAASLTPPNLNSSRQDSPSLQSPALDALPPNPPSLNLPDSNGLRGPSPSQSNANESPLATSHFSGRPGLGGSPLMQPAAFNQDPESQVRPQLSSSNMPSTGRQERNGGLSVDPYSLVAQMRAPGSGDAFLPGASNPAAGPGGMSNGLSSPLLPGNGAPNLGNPSGNGAGGVDREAMAQPSMSAPSNGNVNNQSAPSNGFNPNLGVPNRQPAEQRPFASPSDFQQAPQNQLPQSQVPQSQVPQSQLPRYQIPQYVNSEPFVTAGPIPCDSYGMIEQAAYAVPGYDVCGGPSVLPMAPPPAYGNLPYNYAPPPILPDAAPGLYAPDNSGLRPLFTLGQENYNVGVGRGIIGQPVAYVNGQPFRNFLRYLFP